MAHEIRKSVYRRIAEQKRCSLKVASFIYGCKPIAVKQRLCEEEAKRQARAAAAMQCEHLWASQDEIGRPYCAACGMAWSLVRRIADPVGGLTRD